MSDINRGHFPFEFRAVDPKEIAELLKNFHGLQNDFVRVGPKGYFVPKEFENHAADIYNMPVRSSDIFVTSFQRSGTTWTQELVWLVAKNLDYATANSTLLTKRYAFLEFKIMFKAIEYFMKRNDDTERTQQILNLLLEEAANVLAASDPRFVKTHLPLSLLPPSLLDTAKVVYVARDPRDVAVSCYYHSKLYVFFGYTGDFKQFWNLFKNNIFTLTPYFEHVKEAWAKRHHPNMLFLFYEELSKDLPVSIHRVANFLGKELTANEVAGLCDHLSIENFKNNMSVNREETRQFGILAPEEKFIRKGKAGGWRDYFDAEMTQDAERWIADNLRDTDLRFPSMENLL